MQEWKRRVAALKRHRHQTEKSFFVAKEGFFHQLNKQSENVVFCPSIHSFRFFFHFMSSKSHLLGT